jgi:hypothetical protein
MSCTLRIGGDQIDGPHLQSALTQLSTTRTARLRPDQKRVLLELGPPGFDSLSAQIEAAIAFLRQHETALQTIFADKRITVATLDFGVEKQESRIDSQVFSADLLLRAGKLGIDLEVSMYPTSSNGCG